MEQKKLILYSSLSHQAKVLLLQNEIETIDHLMRLSQDELIRLQRLDQNVGSEISSYIENHQTSSPSGFKQIRDWVRQSTNRVIGRFQSHNDSNHQNGNPLVRVIENDVKESLVDGPQVEETSLGITVETVSTDETLTQTKDNEEDFDYTAAEIGISNQKVLAILSDRICSYPFYRALAVRYSKALEKGTPMLDFPRIYDLLCVDAIRERTAQRAAPYDFDIEELYKACYIPAAACRSLKACSINTICDVLLTPPDALLHMKGLGSNSVRKLYQQIERVLIESEKAMNEHTIDSNAAVEAISKDDVAEETVSENIPSRETMAECAAPMGAIADEIVPEETVPVTTTVEDVVPKAAEAGDVASEITEREEVIAENSALGADIAEDTVSKTAEPEAVMVDDAAPEAAEPEKIMAEDIVPEEASVEAALPEAVPAAETIGAESIEEEAVTINKGELSSDDLEIVSGLSMQEIVSHNIYKKLIIDYLKDNDINLDTLSLSVRSKNTLFRNKIFTMSKLLETGFDNIAGFRNLGKKSLDEITKTTLSLLESKREQIIAYKFGEEALAVSESALDMQNRTAKIGVQSTAFDQENEDDQSELSPEVRKIISSTPVHILLKKPVYRKAILDYFASHDIQVTNMPLSVRSKNALIKNKIDTFSQLLALGVDDLFNIRNIGRLSIDDIQKASLAVLESSEGRIKAYLCGTQVITYTDQQLCQDLIHYFNKMAFSGVSFTQICEALPEGIDHERIKKLVGSLIADGTLEYVDYRCYRVYPSIFSVLADDAFRAIVKHPDELYDKLKGETLEAIGQKIGITRSRVQQIIEKEFKTLKQNYRNKTGMHYFDEDYYGYLYKTYFTEKDLWLKYLAVPPNTLSYLKNVYKAGNRPIEKALDDPRLNLQVRLCIQDYLNRNKILIEGVLVEKSRAAVEDLFLKNHCQDEMKFEDFAAAINRYLEENNVPYDDKIYYTDAVIRTRGNRIGAAMNCLWKQGSRLRYYNIEERDYSELLETIDLDRFENIELSTLKFFEDYPELMQRYDIRDQYELHNLLKKIVPEGSYHDLSFGRQPTITFGTFDRAQAVLDLLILLSPVSAEELVDRIHREYGYDKATIQATVLAPLKQYYHEGVYSVTFKRPTAEREAALLQMLADDFYYIDDVRQIYLNGFPGADPQEINPFTLKEMGFKVNARYAFKNYPTAESYFIDQLTKQDTYDISGFKRKYNGLTTASAVYIALRQQYEIFLFDNNQIITLTRLKQFQIDKPDINQFCADVNEFVTDNTYFNYYALRKEGFHSKLDMLGFDDTFYDGILEVCPYFKPIKLQGNTLLYKSFDERETTRSAFFCWLISNYGSIEQDDLVDLCSEEFGIQLTDKYSIFHIIRSTNIYYDPIMGKYYRNKEMYYSEFDDEGEEDDL